MPRPATPITPGTKFGEWTVLARAPKHPWSLHARWTCQCSCGVVRDVRGATLRDGGSLRCSPGPHGIHRGSGSMALQQAKRNERMAEQRRMLGLDKEQPPR
jgi:hypothetical protein